MTVDGHEHVPLPRAWPKHARSGFVQALGLARMAVLVVRGWAANSSLERARLQVENERLRTEVALLTRELELKDARMARLEPARRPHYAPSERLAILMLAAARGWTMATTAKRFLVTATTIALWQARCDEDGPDALVRTQEPVNRFPDFVARLVQELKATMPHLGRRKLAEYLARAGLHLSASTAKRLLERQSAQDGRPPEPPGVAAKKPSERSIVARYPGHVWGVDLTVMPLGGGLRVPWLPLFLPLCWPFCWWILVVVDHYSRAIVHVAVFSGQPSSADVCAALGDVVGRATGPPKYLVTDQGAQFQDESRRWCASAGIKPRFGAIGKHGSIAVVERLHRTLKSQCLRRFVLPLRKEAMLAELELAAGTTSIAPTLDTMARPRRRSGTG